MRPATHRPCGAGRHSPAFGIDPDAWLADWLGAAQRRNDTGGTRRASIDSIVHAPIPPAVRAPVIEAAQKITEGPGLFRSRLTTCAAASRRWNTRSWWSYEHDGETHRVQRTKTCRARLAVVPDAGQCRRSNSPIPSTHCWRSFMSRDLTAVDLADPALFAAGIPQQAFAAMRATPGLFWNAIDGDASDGFWAVTRHADIVEVSRDPETFSSAVGHIMIYDIDDDARCRASMIDMDPPSIPGCGVLSVRRSRHATCSRTPRSSGRVRAARRSHRTRRRGLGRPLPSEPIGVICDILGVPEADHALMIELSDHLVAAHRAPRCRPMHTATPRRFACCRSTRQPRMRSTSTLISAGGAARTRKTISSPSSSRPRLMVSTSARKSSPTFG